MADSEQIRAAIVDYSLGNLFSVKHACAYAGMEGFITSSKEEILAADAVILPGVGAYGDAMNNLRKLDLVGLLQDIAASGKLLIGICLGQQLFMTESYEFGTHKGLGLIEGPVVRFENPTTTFGEEVRALKVPQVGWNRICKPNHHAGPLGGEDGLWTGTPLEGLQEGEFMYFVHSFYTKPENPDVILTTSEYGNIKFCSSLRHGNIFACQFHPERSGPQGLHVYENIATLIRERRRADV
jgi:glutamine amidotransferase